MESFLDRFPFAPLYSLIGVVTVCIAFVVNELSVQDFALLFGVVTAGPGVYALGRNVAGRRSH